MPHQRGQEQQEGEHTQGTCTFLPVYALQEPEVELLLGVLWPARVVNEHQAGRRAPSDLPARWEGEVHSVQSPGWAFRLPFNAVRKPESIWGKADAKV